MIYYINKNKQGGANLVYEKRELKIQIDDDNSMKEIIGNLDSNLNYIRENNGTNNSYFRDYKGGTVSIVCNQTGETVYEEMVR